MTGPTYRDLADENSALRQELAETRAEANGLLAAVATLTAERDELRSVAGQMARLNDSAAAINLMVQRDEALRQRDEAREVLEPARTLLAALCDHGIGLDPTYRNYGQMLAAAIVALSPLRPSQHGVGT